MGKRRMKFELCSFSGFKIYPGHGWTMVKSDGKTYKFLSAKTQRAHDLKRNPRKITWTVLYRRKHRKGIEEESTRKRTKKTQKFQRAVVGASLNDILAKRNQKPEVRKAQREQAIRAAKEAKKAAKPAKKAAAKDAKATKSKDKAVKNVQKAGPGRVGGK